MRAIVVFVPALLFLLGGVGCAKQQLGVSMDAQTGGEPGHYVLLVTKNDNMKVYDCLSRPDGHTWDPTCVKADIKNEPSATTVGH